MTHVLVDLNNNQLRPGDSHQGWTIIGFYLPMQCVDTGVVEVFNDDKDKPTEFYPSILNLKIIDLHDFHRVNQAKLVAAELARHQAIALAMGAP